MRFKAAVCCLMVVALALTGCDDRAASATVERASQSTGEKVTKETAENQLATAEDRTMADETTKNDAEWKKKLTPEQYEVTRCSATEAPFSGKYWNHKGDGTYMCVCCGAALFDSKTKFNSGTGWPSFFAEKEKGTIAQKEDRSHGMVRTEVQCGKCGAHLGHLFDDGPAPTGMRYCINSASLNFEGQDKKGK